MELFLKTLLDKAAIYDYCILPDGLITVQFKQGEQFVVFNTNDRAEAVSVL